MINDFQTNDSNTEQTLRINTNCYSYEQLFKFISEKNEYLREQKLLI